MKKSFRREPKNKPIKLFWWRLDNSTHGNFGDEITRLIIKKIFKRDVVWAPASECEMIGAGSILAEVYETKGKNKPFVWSAGFIEDRDLTVDAIDFKFTAVRGKLTLGRIKGKKSEIQSINLGDAGLLAGHLLPSYKKIFVQKRYKIGILPHYKEKGSEFIRAMTHRDSVQIIDATWSVDKVINEINKCEVLLSSSLHGLIIADSIGIPNKHLTITSLVEGGSYKFRDYYSVFDTDRYKPIMSSVIEGMSTESVRRLVADDYVEPRDLKEIQQKIINSFPF